jgi:hypothetical protein
VGESYLSLPYFVISVGMIFMDKKLILMCKDVVVGEHSGKESGEWKILNPSLVPLGLNIRQSKAKGSFLDYDSSMLRFIDWCSRRILGVDRCYAKKILNSLSLTQETDSLSRAKISLTYRCASVCDSYWIKFNESENIHWSNVSLYENILNKSIALIALSGTNLITPTKKIRHTAEVSTGGSYAKGWFRGDNNTLWLYKTYGQERRNEVEREVCASKVIGCFNVYGNLKYEVAYMNKIKCSRCKVMSNNNVAIVHSSDVNRWCVRNGINFINWVHRMYPREFAQMIVIDYLIGNSDRHALNWGFYQNMNDGKILGLHPLYDHNNAFDSDALEDDDYMSLVEDGKTMKEAAMYWIKYSNLKLVKHVSPSIFPDRKSYTVFRNRCKQLSL